MINKSTDKSMFIFRSTDTSIDVGYFESDETFKFKFVNFDYVVGLCMGLNFSEL